MQTCKKLIRDRVTTQCMTDRQKKDVVYWQCEMYCVVDPEPAGIVYFALAIVDFSLIVFIVYYSFRVRMHIKRLLLQKCLAFAVLQNLGCESASVSQNYQRVLSAWKIWRRPNIADMWRSLLIFQQLSGSNGKVGLTHHALGQMRFNQMKVGIGCD